MKQSYEFPRITTRGYYDLNTGKPIKFNNDYNLYPKKKFNKIFKSEKEVVIFIHGMRNTRKGAVMGGQTLRRTLRKLGYKKYPVVSFSYDADIRGVHLLDKPHDIRLYHKIVNRANRIARHNGKKHLSVFIHDLKQSNPNVKIHLVGHSLGCNVIEYIREPVESIHLLGSPVEWDEVIQMGIDKIANRIVNYYNPNDMVIQEGVVKKHISQPSCLHKVRYPKTHIYLRNCKAENHGLKAYAKELKKFP